LNRSAVPCNPRYTAWRLPLSTRTGLRNKATRDATFLEINMNMSVLVHMPAETMGEYARHGARERPVAARIEREWAAAGIFFVMALVVLTFVFAR
jgi:hypothetical protein